jgi:hypothetical protein
MQKKSGLVSSNRNNQVAACQISAAKKISRVQINKAVGNKIETAQL